MVHYRKLEIIQNVQERYGLPKWHRGKESSCQCRRCGFSPWVRKIPWRRIWQPNPVFLPGKFHRQKSVVVSYSPWGCKESDTTEHTWIYFD